MTARLVNGHRSRRPRRTEGVRVRGRSARVVSEVLRATVEEIGRVGYEALRVEDVASRSAVNKTTIYRRWPTKFDLVIAAVVEFSASPALPSTGSAHSDLIELLKVTVARAGSPLGCGILRMLQTEGAHPEVNLVLGRIKTSHHATRRLVIERAIERGELPLGTDADLVVELVFAPVFRRVIDQRSPADDAFLEATVSVVMAGARAGAAIRRAAPRRAARGFKGRP